MKKIIVGGILLFSGLANSATLSLDSSKINFNLITSSDNKIEKAFLKVRCLRGATFWEQLNNGLKDYMTCDDFKINGQNISLDTKTVELAKDVDGEFKLPKLNIEYKDRKKGHVCLALSVKFEGVPSYSSDIYENSTESYSLHSFCTMKKLPFSISSYVYENKRVDSLLEFTDRLERGVDVILKH